MQNLVALAKFGTRTTVLATFPNKPTYSLLKGIIWLKDGKFCNKNR